MTTASTASRKAESVTTVDPHAAQQWLDAGEAVLIDVREADEHARERIANSTLAPLATLDAKKISSEHAGRKVIVHCQSGQRSMQAATQLAQAGHTDVHSLEGGITRWRKVGLPTHVDRRAPLPIMRQVQIAAGSLVLIGVVLGVLVSQWWLILSGFVGAGLIFAGVSGFCGMANLLQLLPWNRNARCSTE